MIKRIEFGPAGPAGIDAQRDAARASGHAPIGVRPRRVVTCTSLPTVLPDPPHAVITLEWFADLDHLDAYHGWRASAEHGCSGDLVIAEEEIMRGADWLAARWRVGGPKLKHMALARRAAGLTPAQFSDRWRGRAGVVGSASGASVVIPGEARGRAYVQNHPVGARLLPQPYDAVNEVYFDDEASLRVRIDWFARHLPDGREEGLVDRARFVAVREDLIWDESCPTA